MSLLSDDILIFIPFIVCGGVLLIAGTVYGVVNVIKGKKNK